MQAVILAAGRGKRLHPITAKRTKAMAPVVSKPIIERVMETLIENGIKNFFIVASPDDREIVNYFEEVSHNRREIIIIPQPEPLGMGHALLQAVPYLQNDFLLTSCDNLVDPVEIHNMLEYWYEEQPNAILSTLTVGPEEIVRMGIVELKGNQVIRIVEKPSLETAPSNIGSVPLYLFSKHFVPYLSEIKPSPRGEYELQDAIQMLIDRDGSVFWYKLSDRVDLTLPEDLLAINIKYLQNQKSQSVSLPDDSGSNTRYIFPVVIEKEVVIGSNCVIGPNVFIEYGCRIGNSVVLENVVVLRDRSIPDGRVIRDRVVW
jgi:NDP-sugar pyrophosphorylase family protein